MTTPANQTTTQPTEAEKFREELRAQFAKLDKHYQDTRAQLESLQRETGGLRTNIEDLQAEIHQMKSGLATASQPAPQVGTFGQMQIDSIVMIIDEKGTSYKAKGAPYQKHGVRVWDEVLPLLGIDPASLKPGPNALPEPITARVMMNPKTAQPRKVTGRA